MPGVEKPKKVLLREMPPQQSHKKNLNKVTKPTTKQSRAKHSINNQKRILMTSTKTMMKPMKKKHVRFSQLLVIYEHGMELGDHPCCSLAGGGGTNVPPLQLGWETQEVVHRNLDLYEYMRGPGDDEWGYGLERRRHGKELLLSPEKRNQILLNTGDYTQVDFDNVIKSIELIQISRITSRHDDTTKLLLFVDTNNNNNSNSNNKETKLLTRILKRVSLRRRSSSSIPKDLLWGEESTEGGREQQQQNVIPKRLVGMMKPIQNSIPARSA